MTVFHQNVQDVPVTIANISKAPETGLVENTVAAWQDIRQSELPFSQRFNMVNAYDDYIDEIFVASGQKLKNPFLNFAEFQNLNFILSSTITPRLFTSEEREAVFFEEASKIHGLNPNFELKDKNNIRAKISEESHLLRERHKDISLRQSSLGAVGEFVGSAGATISDPLIAGSMLVGAPVAAGIVRTMIVEGLIAGGVEAVTQPAIQKYRAELGFEDAGFEAGARNVAFATIGGAAFAGMIKGFGRMAGWSGSKVKRVFADVVKNPRPEVRGAMSIFNRSQEMGEDNPMAPSPVGDKEHIARTDASLEAAVDAAPSNIPDKPSAPVKTDPVVSSDGVVGRFDPRNIIVDAKRFQFKAGGDVAGVTERLKGVEVWDDTKAGLTLLFEDADGKLLVADGHQRIGLARRLLDKDPDADIQVNALVLRASDGLTDTDVRTIAAAKNIAEGAGSAIDAAKILREGGTGLNLPPRSALVRQAQDLTRLSDDGFGLVVNEIVPAHYAALVGKLIDDPDLHRTIMEVLAKAEPANLVQAEAIIRQAKNAGATKEVQVSLFGEEELTTSLFVDRARILDKGLNILKRDKKVFKTLVDEENKIVGQGANRLDADTNIKQETINGRAIEVVQRLAHSKGVVSDALNLAARRARKDGRDTGAVNDFVNTIRNIAGGSDQPRGRIGGRGRGIEAESQAGPTPIDETLDEFGDPTGAGAKAQEEAMVAELLDGPDEGDVSLGLFVDDGNEVLARTMTRKQMKVEIKDDESFIKTIEGCLK
ncbi:MAG: hypothetical protein L3J58_11840 [Emcibacter sp.]|nr:hypothetical protein [Emcibacter sp.]